MSAPIVHKAPPEGGIRVINAAQPWGLRNLFSGVVQGAWCDPEAGNTQFQDAAATSPVIAVEQQLGARLDRSGWGHHATQATAGKRPAYSRRVNLLTNTEDATGWGYYGSSFGASTKDADDGFVITQLKNSGFRSAAITTDYPVGSAPLTNITIVRSIEAKYVNCYTLKLGGASTASQIIFNVLTGSVVTNAVSLPFVVTPLADGWFRFEFWCSRASNSATELSAYFDWGTQSIGDAIKVRKPIFAMFSLGYANTVPYQRVNTSVDYDADPEKFPAYLTANGTSHMMQSASGAGGTTGFYYCAPIRLLKLGAVQVLWSDAVGNTGYEVRINVANQLELSAGTGAARVSVASAALVLGRTYILTATHDGAALSVQVDSGAPVSAACGPIAAGTAGYTIFRAAGTDTGYANVREYGFVYTKNHCPSATHRAMAAQILAAKARITL